ncbi:helix-turn-helix domain-containing protein [Aquimarina sp. Aq78]|uniref:helix-turn-helix domain-containing protein n=1 Tax=Aquimarina sp. Aq78 TaxID=1191889 RepID=UPI000D111918|nr:helix-turn-helix domain-containing protein [Aquimarina sp. Aq78]
MNIKKYIGDKIVIKVSAILVCGIVFLFMVMCYKMLSTDVFLFNTRHMFAMLIVLNIVLLITIFTFFFSSIVLKNFSNFYFRIPLFFNQVFAVAYNGVFTTTKQLTPEFDKVKSKKDLIRSSISNFSTHGLDQIFSEKEHIKHQNTSNETIGILSYFASSLFEKNKLEDVLWDIVENCISQLELEDCVIYMLDTQNRVLIQKAAFGHKNNGERKVVSPIQIPLGEGIVGRVAQSGTFEYVPDVTKDSGYIIDDDRRMSELSVPIFIGDEVVGVLDSEHSQKDFFSNNHVFLFQLIARLTGKKLKQIHIKNESHITNDNVYFKELDFLMKEAKIYRDPNLGLDSMAKKLNISGNYLSQLVNKLSGYNFTDYVNRYRIKDAKFKLRNPNFINYTIIAIALESGFNSKSTFYSAFKKLTGISPKEYRKIS